MRSTTPLYILCFLGLAVGLPLTQSIATADTIIEPQSVMGVDVDIWITPQQQGMIDPAGGGQVSFDVKISGLDSMIGLGLWGSVTGAGNALEFDHGELHADLLSYFGDDFQVVNTSDPNAEMVGSAMIPKDDSAPGPDVPDGTTIATFVYNYTDQADGVYAFELDQTIVRLWPEEIYSTKSHIGYGDALDFIPVPMFIPDLIEFTTLTFINDGQATIEFGVVPEPTTMALLTMAVAGIAAARRRK